MIAKSFLTIKYAATEAINHRGRENRARYARLSHTRAEGTKVAVRRWDDENSIGSTRTISWLSNERTGFSIRVTTFWDLSFAWTCSISDAQLASFRGVEAPDDSTSLTETRGGGGKSVSFSIHNARGHRRTSAQATDRKRRQSQSR